MSQINNVPGYVPPDMSKGWRISDIAGNDWSLLAILSSPE